MPSTISVTLPNYNDAQHLPASVKALCEQSHPPKEIVIVDDASTDNSLEVINELMSMYPCVRLVRNEVNMGCVPSVNRSFAHLSGDYVYLASANDLVLPGLFEKSVHILEKYPDAGMSCADQLVEHLHTGATFDVTLGWATEPEYISPDQAAEAIRRTGKFPLSSMLYKREYLNSNHVYNSRLEWHCDFWLTAVTMLRHGICYIPEQLAVFRYSPRSYSATGRRNFAKYSDVFAEFMRLLASPEYEDITKLIIKADWLFTCPLPVRNPITAFRAVNSLEERNRYANALVRMVALDFGRDAFVFSGRRLFEILVRPILEVFGRVKNLGDQIYARAFHEYKRLRNGL